MKQSSVKQRNQLHEQSQKAVEEFLKNGGKIKKCRIGEMSDYVTLTKQQQAKELYFGK